jgi:hypothetical protein
MHRSEDAENSKQNTRRAARVGGAFQMFQSYRLRKDLRGVANTALERTAELPGISLRQVRSCDRD